MPKLREKPLLASAFGKTGQLKPQLVPLWLSVYFFLVEVYGYKIVEPFLRTL